MQQDILDYLVMADQSKKLGFSRQTHGLSGAFDVLLPGKWYHLKSVNGYPWDIKLFDEQFIYDWITELNWNDPRSYKKFVQNHGTQSGLADGVVISYRYINPDNNSNILFTAKARSTYQMYTNCIWDNQTHDIGDIKYTLSGPHSINHGGDIGRQPTLIMTYQWNGSRGEYADMEENMFALNYGWVSWSHSKKNLSTGRYEIDVNAQGKVNLDVHNVLQAHVPPAVNFPCF